MRRALLIRDKMEIRTAYNRHAVGTACRMHAVHLSPNRLFGMDNDGARELQWNAGSIA